jgi:hypothetical protein
MSTVQTHILHRNNRRYHLGDYAADSKNGLLNSLVGYWKLDEAAAATRLDSTANAHDLTQPVGTCGQSTGIISFAANTNGGGSKLRNSASSSQSTFWANIQSGDSFSMSSWFKFNVVPTTGFHGVLSFWNQSTISYFLWFANNNSLIMQFNNAANNAQPTLSVLAPPSTATWYHIVMGYDDTNHQMFYYLNNGARTNASITGIFKATTGTVAFELMDYASSGGPPDMIMDETGWWRRVLSSTDVALLYNSGAGTPYGSFTT